MKLFGWVIMSRRSTTEDTELRNALHEQSIQSKSTQDRIDKIVQLEKIRLRNLELRAEVLSRTRIING